MFGRDRQRPTPSCRPSAGVVSWGGCTACAWSHTGTRAAPAIPAASATEATARRSWSPPARAAGEAYAASAAVATAHRRTRAFERGARRTAHPFPGKIVTGFLLPGLGCVQLITEEEEVTNFRIAQPGSATRSISRAHPMPLRERTLCVAPQAGVVHCRTHRLWWVGEPVSEPPQHRVVLAILARVRTGVAAACCCCLIQLSQWRSEARRIRVLRYIEG